MRAEKPSSLLVQNLRSAIVDAADLKSGWGYYKGHEHRLEPTAWAMMALAATDRPTTGSRNKQYLSFITTLQRADGLLVETATAGPNLAWNGLTLLTLSLLPFADTASLQSRILAGVIAAKGIRIAQDATSIVKQNTSLQAWAWIEGTFSWVEPTAFCLLALKKATPRSDSAVARIAEAEAVLFDRVCQSGGWNYGNSNALGQGLEPYVPTTALALLAMQDKADHPDIVRSLGWLEAHATRETSAMALGLAAICLHAFKRPIDNVLASLTAQGAKTNFMGNMHLSALALYALTIGQHRAAAFTL